jgi:hypothetical protein
VWNPLARIPLGESAGADSSGRAALRLGGGDSSGRAPDRACDCSSSGWRARNPGATLGGATDRDLWIAKLVEWLARRWSKTPGRCYRRVIQRITASSTIVSVTSSIAFTSFLGAAAPRGG